MEEEYVSFLESVDLLLQQCVTHYNIQDVGFVLRVVSGLQNALTVFQQVIRSDGSDELENLVPLLRLLLIHWEQKLFEQETTSLPQPTLEAMTREPINWRGRGRPTILINPDQIEFLLSVGRSMEQISQTLLISRRTLYRRCEEFNICKKRERYSELSDSQLDDLVRNLTTHYPTSGIRMLMGHLRAMNVNITRERLRGSLLRINPMYGFIRQLHAIQRRTYNVANANSLWHIDGLHCLIRWRLVIHGGIDGFSRLVVYLKCSNNNQASTVSECFINATERFGWPSRVRSDKGGENVEVAYWMFRVKGLNRGSHIAGSSTHNQRIERLWRDVFRCVCALFYSLFYMLEDFGLLNPTDDVDLFCLHYIFTPRINRALMEYSEAHNHHPIRTERNWSPYQLWYHSTIAGSNDDPVDLNDYGIDLQGPPDNGFDVEHVEIPETTVALSDNQMSEISTTVNPLQYSDSHGVELYLQLRQQVRQFTA